MIASVENHSNRRYADYNAYSNMAYNTNKPFSMVYKELRLPTNHYQHQRYAPESLIDYSGGVSLRNMEGSGGVLGDRFHSSVLREDIGVPALSRVDSLRRPTGYGYTGGMNCSSHRDMSCMSGCGDCSCSDSDEEDDRMVGCSKPVAEMAAEMKSMIDKYEAKQPEHMKTTSFSKPKKMTKAEVAEASKHFSSILAKKESGAGVPKYMPSTGEHHEGFSLGAGKRKPSAWIQHVKAFASKHGMKYGDALKSPECKASYKKMKGGFLPLLASVAAPYAIKGAVSGFKALYNKIRGKKKAKAPAPPAKAPVVPPPAPLATPAPSLGSGHSMLPTNINPPPHGISGRGRGKKPSKAFMKALCKHSGKSEAELKDSPELKEAHEKYMELTSGMSGKGVGTSKIIKYVLKGLATMPFNAIKLGIQKLLSKGGEFDDDVNPMLPKSQLFSEKRTKKGGSVLGGPSNDVVNGSKITGGRVVGVVHPKYMKPIGEKYEGATLGAGRKAKKTGSALFKTQAVLPLDVKSGIPPTEAQVEELQKFKEIEGNGKKGGKLKTLLHSSSFSGGAKRKPSAWIQHVKDYASKHGMKYGDALKSAKASYKKA
jgi:hypothetical protein